MIYRIFHPSIHLSGLTDRTQVKMKAVAKKMPPIVALIKIIIGSHWI